MRKLKAGDGKGINELRRMPGVLRKKLRCIHNML